MNRILLTVILLLLMFAATGNASWLVFHKSEFTGKVVDIETNEPIEGAAVVAIYRVHSLAVADSVDYSIGAQESLTDKNGEFRIPSYTTMIQPLSWSIPTEIIFFKPGYVCDGDIGREEDFSGERTKSDREYIASWNRSLKYRIAKNGIVMLRKVNGKDRIESFRKATIIYNFKIEAPNAYNIIHKENNFITNN